VIPEKTIHLMRLFDMSAHKPNQLKFMLGMIAMTSFAALTPAAHAETAVVNIMQRANLSVASAKLQPGQQLSPSVQQLPGSTKLRKAVDDNNGACNGACGGKLTGHDLVTNPAINSGIKLRQIGH
jgi:hypothetical protein